MQSDQQEGLAEEIGWKYEFLVLSPGFLAATLAGTDAPLFTAVLLVFGPGTAIFMDHIHKSRWLILLMCTVLAIVFAPIGPSVYLKKHHYGLGWVRQKSYDTLDSWMNH